MTVPADLYAELDTRVDQISKDLVAWRHHIHQNPELSNREVKTAAFIEKELKAAGLDEVRTGIAGLGIVGVLRGGQPGDRVIALRADIDALPIKETSGEPFASTVVDHDYPGGPYPVAHACGHDCHTAVLMASAHVLAKVRDKLPGTVLFVFQPAEEGPPPGEIAGAKAMLDAGALEDPKPTMVFGMHVGGTPKGTVAWTRGPQYASSCVVSITITGEGSHGSTPWMGRDPMPVAGEIISGIGQVYRQIAAYEPITISIGHVEDAGRFNTLGGEVTLWGTIRCLENNDMPMVQDKLKALAEGHASAYGCTAEVTYEQYVPSVDNTQAWLDAVLPTVRRVIGDDKVFEGAPTLGYDDVSYFINACGGTYLIYGVQDTVIGENGIPVAATKGGRGFVDNHNSGFYALDEALPDDLRVFVNVAVDHLYGVVNPPTADAGPAIPHSH